VSDIKQKIKELNISRGKKIILTKLLRKIERMENEKIISIDGHDRKIDA